MAVKELSDFAVIDYAGIAPVYYIDNEPDMDTMVAAAGQCPHTGKPVILMSPKALNSANYEFYKWHEFGHLHHGHRPCPDTPMEWIQEIDADKHARQHVGWWASKKALWEVLKHIKHHRGVPSEVRKKYIFMSWVRFLVV